MDTRTCSPNFPNIPNEMNLCSDQLGIIIKKKNLFILGY